MSNKKQTAVEWLADQIEYFGNKHELQMSWVTLDELFVQAKAMEKEQIKDAYVFGLQDEYVIGSENYYKENYEQ